MCFHTSNKQPTKKEMELQYQRILRYPELYEQQYHITGFAHPKLMGLVQNENEILPLTWGIVESETIDIEAYWKKEGGRCLNTQSEFVFKNKRTHNAILENRCVIPVTGFFEPHQRNGRTFPQYVHPKDDCYLSLLGCFQRFDELLLFTILTSPANTFLSAIHNSKKRMPVMSSLVDDWLDPNLNEQQIKEIMYTDTDQELSAYPVMKSVTNTRVVTNSPEALKEFYYPELDSLF